MLRRAVGLFRLKDSRPRTVKGLRLPFGPPPPTPVLHPISYIDVYTIGIRNIGTCGRLYHSPSTLYTVYYVLCTLYTLVDDHIFYAEDFYYNNE